MTSEETRQLGIEFERRVLTMIPEKEYLDKLDTETIYSFLNQFQDKYIEEVYKNLEQLLTENRRFPNIDNILQSLQRTKTVDLTSLWEEKDYLINTMQDNPKVRLSDLGKAMNIEIDDMYVYVRSVSGISQAFRLKKNLNANETSLTRIVPNKLMSLSEVNKIIESPNNDLRILRNPIAVLSTDGTNKTLAVIYDRYTKADFVRILYYKKPNWFSILTDTPCELPSSAFDDLVTGAVDLYTNYVAGAEARKRQMQESAQKRNEDNDE